MKKILVLIFVLCSSAMAQYKFELTNASQYFDIEINVATCDENSCTGKASYSFYKKGGTVAYQTINIPDTYVDLGDGGKPEVNKTLLYDKQSVVNIGDFNFDGMEDVAICNGTNGSYGMPSYNIYLSSKVAKKFVYNAAFSALGTQLGMFGVDKEKKTLETFGKSGCCWHVATRYSVVAGRPVKIWEEVEDATIQDETKIKVTTKTLVNGRWKTSVKYVKREE